MTTYYIKENDKIVLHDTDKEKLITTLDFMPQYQGLEILETGNLIIDGEILTQEEYEAKLEEQETERVNNLTMTALDFITGITKFGLSLEAVNEYLESNLPLKMQLTYCQNVYCGVVKKLCPLSVGDFTLTSEMVEAMFLLKAGEISEEDFQALIPSEETPEPEPESETVSE